MQVPGKQNIGSRGQITVSFSDSINLIREEIHWTPKGVRLLTKWHFADGSEVEFAFDHKGERHCCSGIVVGCHPLSEPAGYYETILFFIETPCSRLQKAACDCRLASQNAAAQDETHFTLSSAMAPRNLRKASPTRAFRSRP